MLLPNLTQLTLEQIDEALQNAGYLENDLEGATVKYVNVLQIVNAVPTFHYRITYAATPHGEAGELGDVYVHVTQDGAIAAEF